jgi:DNA-binding transcriptional MerR regulator
MTIDEVARQSGTTTRNVRAYQERGLLPPPRVVGRVGYYSESHLARLKHIAELSDRGFSQAAIRELFRAWEHGYGLEEVLGFERALAAPWDSERAVRISVDDLQRRFGVDGVAQGRALKLGLVVADDDEGQWFRVPSPRLLEAGLELMATGVPLERVLDEAARMRADLDRIAARMVALFREFVWTPYEEAGRPPEDLPRITEALNRMRPVAAMAIGPVFAQAIGERVSQTAAETLANVPDTAPAGSDGAGRAEAEDPAE